VRRPGRALVRGLALAGSLAFGVGVAAAQEAPVEVAASPIQRFDSATPIGATYGKLVFLGGVTLSSRDKDFGGLSGLRLSDDGRRFTAISDRGNWFRGAIAYDGATPTGVSGVVRSPIVGPRGPLPGRRGADTESLDIRGGSAWIASERVHEVLRFALDADGRAGAGRLIKLPKAVGGAPSNAGYEAIATLSSGALMMIGEKYLDAAGNNRAFVVGTRTPFEFTVKRTEDFSPTDVARLPGGGFVLLERRYVPPLSLSVRMRRLSEADVKAGTVVDGPVLMEATLSQAIDNLEGVATHRGADGRTVITAVSDDNFSGFQRTVLLQFALPE